MKLDDSSCKKYCYAEHKDSEAWSLVCDTNQSMYLQHEADILPPSVDPFSFGTLPVVKPPGYDFQNYAATFPSFGHRNTESVARSRSMPAQAFAFAGELGKYYMQD